MKAVRVVDASVIVHALGGEGAIVSRASAVLMGEDCVAPELIDFEVIHAFRGLNRGGKLSAREGQMAVANLRALPIVRRSHSILLGRVWELRHNLSAYDATYVALAEALRCPLITSDERIAAASRIRCEVVVIG